MDIDFWLQRWENGQTGFHLAYVNPCLEHYWPAVTAAGHQRVFVPLCGKSRDMHWLAGLGHHVVGCEWSAQAVEDYFIEAGTRPEIRHGPRFTHWQQDRVEILCGDFFDLNRQDTGMIDAFYDRASLIALPGTQRETYAQHLAGLTRSGTPGLLITLDYGKDGMEGPPFAVPGAEVMRLFGENFEIRQVHSEDVLDEHPRFRDKGLAELTEEAWILRRR